MVGTLQKEKEQSRVFNVAKRVARQLKLDVEESATSSDERLLAALIGGAANCTDDEVRAALSMLTKRRQTNDSDDDVVDEALRIVREECVRGDSDRHHVILVLDDRLQQLPLESMPSMRTTFATRVPSLAILHALLARHSSLDAALTPRNASDLYYVLNPAGDLKKTQVTTKQKQTKKHRFHFFFFFKGTI